MDDNTLPSPTDQSVGELEQLRQALTAKYPDATDILGAQLGAFIRDQLADPDLKRRFGGLKNFLTRYFPAEIRWRGKKGLDDLYDVHFGGGDASPVRDEGWQPVRPEASPWLWSSVTNPSTAVQFAWSPEGCSLMRATLDAPRTEGLSVVAKLSKEDYRTIARNFVASMKSEDVSRYFQAIEASESSVEFTNIMREEGLLPKWEEFRVDSAVQLFASRLVGAGVDGNQAAQWADVLRSSQQQARNKRLRKISDDTGVQKLRESNPHYSRSGVPKTRAVATKALEFLSESELSELRLPLGSVMHALRSLISFD